MNLRRALRQILWIVPVLGAASLACFWLLTLNRPWSPLGVERGQTSFAEPPPRFFNANPKDARALADQLLNRIAEEPGDPIAEQELARLGGALLPHVLPNLDTLPPRARARVALALKPVALRMGVAGAEELDDGETAIVFWNRYWQDRGIDFRPTIVRRSVRRLKQRGSALRRADLIQLDTYALPELMRGLQGPVRTPADVAPARRLAQVASHVAGLPWRIPAGATPEQASATLSNWQRWWNVHRAEYVAFDGPVRLSAMVTETQFGMWAADALDSDMGVTGDGRSVRTLLVQHGPITAWLTATALLGGYLLGMMLGVASAALTRRSAERALTFLLLAIIAVPSAWLAAACAPELPSASDATLAALVMLFTSLTLAYFHQRSASRSALECEPAQTLRALGATPLRVARRSFRGASSAALASMAVGLPLILTTAFVVERAFRLPGLGAVTVNAVRAHDVAWLMMLVLCGTLATALLRIVSDALIAWFDPRVAASLDAGRRGVW